MKLQSGSTAVRTDRIVAAPSLRSLLSKLTYGSFSDFSSDGSGVVVVMLATVEAVERTRFSAAASSL